jgi:hypothetical protein
MREVSSIRKVVKFIVPLLLTLILLPSFVYSFSFVSSLPSSYVIKVVPLDENYNPTKAIVVVKVLYPEGFKVVAQKLTNGEPVLAYVDVQNLTNAWNKEEERTHCKALPTFSIVVLTEDRLEDRIFSIQWNELKPFAVKEVYILPKIKREKKVILGEVSKENNLIVLAKKEESKDIKNRYLNGIPEYPLDWYESEKRVVFMKLQTNAHSVGRLDAGYSSYSTLTFSVTVLFESVGSWDVGGWLGLSSSDSYSYGTSVGYSSTGCISMVVREKYEKWLTTTDDIEYIVYPIAFYPKTMSADSGEEAKVNYNIIGCNVPGGGTQAIDPRIYNELSSQYSSYSTSTDLGWFLSLLASIGKLKPLYGLITLVGSAQIGSESSTTIVWHTQVWGDKGYYFSIYKASSQWKGFPTVYFCITQT